MIVWIARDVDGGLFMYNFKPIRDIHFFMLPKHADNNPWVSVWPLPDDELPEITWENSPQEYELDLKRIPINAGCDQ